MTKQEILDSLKKLSKRFPKEAFEEIRANKNDFIPELLESLDYVCKNIKTLYDDENNDYFLHVYAMYLLAEFREKRAFSYIIALMRLPGDYVDYVFGDTLTEDLKNILLCMYDGADTRMLPDIFGIIEDPGLDEWARVAALDAYALLYLEGYVSQEDFIAYIRGLIYDKLADEESDIVNTAVAGCIIDTRVVQMIPDARFLHETEKVDPGMHGEYDGFLDWFFYEKKRKADPRYIDNAAESVSWWSCFEKDEKDDKDEPEPQEDTDKFGFLENYVADGIKKDREQELLIAQKKNKPGRNAPCPCGSGKKYKKCCIDSETPVVAASTDVLLEDKYDLLEMYPDHSPVFNGLYEKEAVEIDKLVYKALRQRSVPMWVKRNLEQEKFGKINYLNEALGLFLDKCAREQIGSFDDYDEKYMVHYRSFEWVAALIDLTEEIDFIKITNIRKAAVDTLIKFGRPE